MQHLIVSKEYAGWEWIDIENPGTEELQIIAEKFKLHPASVKDSLQPEHLPKYEFIEQVLFIITRLHDPLAHLEADTIQELTNKLAIFYTDKFLITIHKYPVTIIQEIKARVTDTNIADSPADTLLRILKGCVRTFDAPAVKLSDDLDYYEAKIFLDRKVPNLNKGLYHLKRKAAVSKRIIQLSEKILGGLVLQEFPKPEVQDLKDAHLLLENQYEEISDSANNLINTYLSIASQKTNDVMRVLTVFSAFFLPLTFIAGIYGMNFEFIPELKMKLGYPAVIMLMVVVTISIHLWFRRKGWL